MSPPLLLDPPLPVAARNRSDAVRFELPPALEATAPPEASGRRRDEVRLLVAHRSPLRVVHADFVELPGFLDPGDVVVVNTSGTLPSAVDAHAADGRPLVVHFSGTLPGDLVLVEFRRPAAVATERWEGPLPAGPIALAGGGSLDLLRPYRGRRLWIAAVDVDGAGDLVTYLTRNGRPIRYGYVPREWPLSAYQTVYATEPGSAEMPSAGRPFTPELVTSLVAKGVDVAPLVLHTGVSSLEAGETPFPEWFRVPEATADRVNAAHRRGGRVVAVGTTVVRALETVADKRGRAHPGEGFTDLVVTADRGLSVVDGLLTGFHEPEASHIQMLKAVAGGAVVERAYAEALAEGYRWHEFGDLNLLLP
jgi:S-adenosylmethionine:tRNA ribosyltransferase-isomerase